MDRERQPITIGRHLLNWPLTWGNVVKHGLTDATVAFRSITPLAEGRHGRVYGLFLEAGSSRTKLWTEVNSPTLTAVIVTRTPR